MDSFFFLKKYQKRVWILFSKNPKFEIQGTNFSFLDFAKSKVRLRGIWISSVTKNLFLSCFVFF